MRLWDRRAFLFVGSPQYSQAAQLLTVYAMGASVRP